MNGEREINELIAQLRALYGDAAQQLANTLDSPGLTAAGAARAGKLIQQVEAMRAALDAKAAELAGKGIEGAYAHGVDIASKAIEETGNALVGGLGTTIHTGAVQALAETMAGDLLNANGAIERQLKSVIRQTQQSVLQENEINRKLATGIIQGKTRKEISKEIASRLREELGDGKYLIIKGRRYDPKYYAELVTRTRTREAVTEGSINQAIQNGFDLMQVTVHSNPCPRCLPFQGRIFSLSGRSTTFPRLTDRPPYHPNCKHVIVPVSEDHLERLGQLEAARRLAEDPGAEINNQSDFEAFRKRAS